MTQDGDDRRLQQAQDRIDDLRQLYEVGHLTVDFLAGVTFTVGSVAFFDKSLENFAIWMFVVGSLAFTAKPCIRLGHKLHDRRTRRRIARELSAEVASQLARIRPVRGFGR